MNKDMENEFRIGEMYQRVTEKGEILNAEDMQFLEERLDEYSAEMLDHLENGTKPTESRSKHATNDIQMIVTMMEKCIEISIKEELDD